MKGDVSLPSLGVTQSEWNELIDGVNIIYHNAAVVNMSLPYSLLKGPNVEGTKEILKLVSLIGISN